MAGVGMVILCAIEALLEAEAASPGSFTQQIHASLNALEKFRSRSLKHAYCAWLWFEGNNDVYYDDNAQVAIAFLRAYSLPSTRRHSYLSSATSITSWLLTGWDSRGGMRWHISKPDARNACTTNLSAIAALKLAAVGGEWIGPRPLLEFAERCAEWVWTELREGSGLIKDGAGGGPTWTYNTGAAIYTQVLLWQANGREGHKERARQLAEVSCDRGKGLFDGSNPCVQERYWWDSMFFMQLLVEGLVEFSCALEEVYPDMARKAGEEVKRHMLYIMKYMKGREDGLYVRNLRMYVVSVKHVEMYRTLTGDIGRKPELDESERWGDAESLKLPVEKRGVCKTLLGNGGAARSLLIAGRLQQ
ncbi:glycosyl hydrolase family 76-domain-containing protein [Pyronema domesticum]|nr:glycosyl hydrolase family 76-domain-containing protein [Pyronema domesticum]